MIHSRIIIYRNSLLLVASIILIIFIINSHKFQSPDSSSNLSLFANPSQPKHVFFDLGANNGDSVLEFFELNSQGIC